jgi:8-oxo-dGTP diphosphatase
MRFCRWGQRGLKRSAPVAPPVELPAVALGPGSARGILRIVPDRIEFPSESPSSPGGPLVYARGFAPPGEQGVSPTRCSAVVVGETGPPGVRAAGVPALGGIAEDLVREGDRVDIDADGRRLRLPEVVEREVVTSFLEDPVGRVLIVRRSDRVGTFRGRWSAISGYLEGDEPIDRARIEVLEETGIPGGELREPRRGEPLLAREDRIIFRVHPFRFRVERPTVKLDWENLEFRWVRPDELRAFETVPKLLEAWCATSRGASPTAALSEP